MTQLGLNKSRPIIFPIMKILWASLLVLVITFCSVQSGPVNGTSENENEVSRLQAGAELYRVQHLAQLKGQKPQLMNRFEIKGQTALK